MLRKTMKELNAFAKRPQTYKDWSFGLILLFFSLSRMFRDFGAVNFPFFFDNFWVDGFLSLCIFLLPILSYVEEGSLQLWPLIAQWLQVASFLMWLLHRGGLAVSPWLLYPISIAFCYVLTLILLKDQLRKKRERAVKIQEGVGE